MTDSNDLHVPTPDFQASLKRELLRAHRTESLFAPPRPSRVRRVVVVTAMAFAAVLALSTGLVVGASTGFASAEVLDARKHASEQAAIATSRQLAALRLEVAQANYNAVQREVAAGTATRAELRVAREEVDSMQAYVARVDVDLAASRTTAPPPRPRLAILSELPMRRALTALACAAVAAAPIPAQAPSQQGIPIVEVSSVAARTDTTIGTVFGVRELPGGRLMVNDPTRKRVLMFDGALGFASTVIDSVPGSAKSYPQNVGRMTSWLGDSTLFGGGGQPLVVLDAAGQIVRAMALPTMGIGNGMSIPMMAPEAVDPKGGLYAKGPTHMELRPGEAFARPADSISILRGDLDARSVTPVGAVRSGGGRGNRGDPPINGRRVVTTIIQPVPTQDAWTVLSDGTLAIVRGQDYRVDWVFADGTKGTTGRLPFDWKRLSDADKQKLVDSARVVWDSLMLIRNKRVGAADANGNILPAAPNLSGDGGSSGGGRAGGAGPPPNNDAGYQRMDFVPLSQIPDFYPAVHANAAMADLDGNLWILPTTSAQSQHGELVYDVVNPKRGLFQRVRMPVGRSVVGFGKGGVVYLQAGDRKTGFHIERVTVVAK